MPRPRLLDLFCGAGGCAMGYHRAGFEVVGVDIAPQPRYPFGFVQADALEYLKLNGAYFDVIHASPPCQRFSTAIRCNKTRRNCRTAEEHPDLVDPVRQLLIASRKLYVIENVPNAPLRDPLLLCGTYFNLRVIRHRMFESNVWLMAPGSSCNHPPRGAVGRAGARGKKVGDWISVAGDVDAAVAGPAMGIDWMTGNRREISQAIPPAYTLHIGRQLIHALAGN